MRTSITKVYIPAARSQGEVYGRQDISREFVVARCDGAEVFECVEESFDQIAFAVEREIAVSLNEAVGFGRNVRL